MSRYLCSSGVPIVLHSTSTYCTNVSLHAKHTYTHMHIHMYTHIHTYTRKHEHTYIIVLALAHYQLQ